MATASEHIRHVERADRERALESVGRNIVRYGLVAILLWDGALKLTAYEAEAIPPPATSGPLMSWESSLMSAQPMWSFAALIGAIEILLALLVAARPFAPKASALGSFGAIVMLLITLGFVLTTPGVWQPGYGFPFPSPETGQFLAKDIMLLGAAVWTAGEALLATRGHDEQAGTNQNRER